MWEDEENRSGGRWLMTVDKKSLDNMWLEIMLGLIGETFGEEVNGAVVSNRRGTGRVGVWMKDYTKVQQ